MKIFITIIICLILFLIGMFVLFIAVAIQQKYEQDEIKDKRLANKDYLTDPTVCSNCGHKHPQVKEFGYCGTCADKIYTHSLN